MKSGSLFCSAKATREQHKRASIVLKTIHCGCLDGHPTLAINLHPTKLLDLSLKAERERERATGKSGFEGVEDCVFPFKFCQ